MLKKMAKTIAQIFAGDPHSKVQRFRKGRARQTDEDFLACCGVTTDTERKIALAVRRAVANVGLVDSQYISHDARWPDDLGVLPVWDSMDAMGYVVALEEELGIEIPYDDACSLFNYQSVSVLDLVHSASRGLKDQVFDSQG